ncbi:MAG: hypothetical protein WCD12_06855 [Candidatus Binatus sp.]|uniref:hypothetical protein n=1 Tax=Candidatus Binatus sp. TaxID=2811406 RepID=UPI003C78D143
MSAGHNRDVAARPIADPVGEVKLDELARRLRSLTEGDIAVIDAIAIGAPAIPVLRGLLFERDPAGIFEPRRRAVHALIVLKATDALKEFVAGWKPAADPVERFGDEVVLGAAARALGTTLNDEFYPVLAAVAGKYPVSEVIEALGYFRRSESIPILLAALADDFSRTAAEQAFRLLGQPAAPALMEVASRCGTNFSGRESQSSIRQRRSALRLMLELGPTRELWERLSDLVQDSDTEIAVLGCRIGLAAAGDTAGRDCACRLVALLPRARWPLNQEIEDCLRDNLAIASEFVDRALSGWIDGSTNEIERARFKRSLRRVKALGSARLDAES